MKLSFATPMSNKRKGQPLLQDSLYKQGAFMQIRKTEYYSLYAGFYIVGVLKKFLKLKQVTEQPISNKNHYIHMSFFIFFLQFKNYRYYFGYSKVHCFVALN